MFLICFSWKSAISYNASKPIREDLATKKAWAMRVSTKYTRRVEEKISARTDPL